MKMTGRQIVFSCCLILGILLSGERAAHGADESAANAVAIRLNADPPAWDSPAAEDGALFECTEDGCVRCFRSVE